MPPMELKIERRKGRLVVHLNGDLDGKGANQVVHTLQRMHGDSRTKGIVLDMRAIKKLEYFGIATLCRFIKKHGRQFHGITLDGLTSSALSVFKRFGVVN